MTPLATARAELCAAARAYTQVCADNPDDDNFVNAIIRLEVAAKAFADDALKAEIKRLTAALFFIKNNYPTNGYATAAFNQIPEEYRKTPPGNQSGGAS